MNNFALLLFCFLGGIVLRQTGRTSPEAHKTINCLIVNLLLPATALTYLHKIKWDSSIVFAAAMPWALFCVAVGFFFLLGRRLGWSKEIIGTLILVGGLGNTSIVGIPMLDALYGHHAIPIAMIVDQAGSYLVMSTLGLFVAAYCGVGHTSWRTVAYRVVTYPPFIGMAVAFLLLPVDYPETVSVLFKRISDCLVPMALLSVGMQMSIKGVGGLRTKLLAGLGFKLVLCPALVMLAYLVTGTKMNFSDHVILVEAAMGPSIGAGIIASQHELNPHLVTLMISVGIPLSVISAPLINMLAISIGV